MHDIGLWIWYVTPLSTLFQVYRGGQFCWWSRSFVCHYWRVCIAKWILYERKV